MSDINLEELVSAYISLRNERASLKDEYEQKDNALKTDMEKLEVAMLGVCNTVNADSIKTTHGTVIRKLNERFYCQDWDNFYKFVLENEVPQLLERRIAQGNFKQYLSDNEADGLPPGVSVMREYGVVVRKSSSSDQ
jgi:hypothetical protein